MQHPSHFTRTQIVLHWTVAVLVACQFLFSSGIERAWREFARGRFEPEDFTVAAAAHMASGMLILALVIWRLVLRYRHGAPAPDPAEPPALQFLAKAAHFALYALIIILPLSGFFGWVFGQSAPIRVHLIAKTILLPLIGLHVVGALVHHFWWRTDVLKRMLGPA
jgi:cytochrome b561